MNIIGFVKNSFVDYPGKIASVVFTPGCNMNCWYCHNHSIINEEIGEYSESKIFEFLSERKGFIDAVVISGGEPTLQQTLKEFIIKVKAMGFLVKLDTNGTNIDMLRELVSDNLLDYIAMDVKAPLKKYHLVTKITEIDLKNVAESIDFIKSCGVEYEFRTTFAPNLSVTDLKEIIDYIGYVNCYSVQQYQTPQHIKEVAQKVHNLQDFASISSYGKDRVKIINIKNM